METEGLSLCTPGIEISGLITAHPVNFNLHLTLINVNYILEVWNQQTTENVPCEHTDLLISEQIQILHQTKPW